MNWDLLGGDPAPGSVTGVRDVAAAFANTADRVGTVRSQVLDVTRSGSDAWTGEAASAFANLSAALPPPLQHALDSFQGAAAALTRYGATLAEAQGDALRLVTAAGLAADDQATAQRRQRAAEDQRSAAEVRVRHATSTLKDAQRAQQLNTDPTQVQVLTARVSAANAALSAARADRDAAKADSDRHAREGADAAQRLAAARRAADEVRERVRMAAASAVSSLQDAQRAGDLPDGWARFRTDASDWLQAHGAEIASTLRNVAGICGLLALLIPGGGPALLIVAGLLSLVALGLDVGVAASSKDGFTADRLWTIAGDAAMTVASLAGGGALMQMGSAGELTQGARVLGGVAKVAGKVGDVATVGQGYSEGGVKGAAYAVGGTMLGNRISSKVASAAPGLLAKANKNPAVSDALQGLSSMTRKAATTAVPGMDSFHVPGYSKTIDNSLRVGQSVLGHGRIPPGGFLPGHGDPHLLSSHATAASVTTGQISDVTEHWVGWLVEKAQDQIGEALK